MKNQSFIEPRPGRTTTATTNKRGKVITLLCIDLYTHHNYEMEADAKDHGQNKTNSCYEDEDYVGIQFSPPLYLQRYMLAVEYLTKHSIQNVIDFGCSECGFFRLLSTVPSLQEISLVDIDHDLLMSKSRVISPQLSDYIHRRSNPLKVFMYSGSAGVLDARMENYEAVTLIEVIEHLNPDVLQLVTENVFGNIHPQHIIVTTPNSEFNVLFENEDPTAFRHWDHKFEWTRAEFQSWCHRVCQSYGYNVEYSGVGFGPSKQESSDNDFGPCSQAAFFQLREKDEMTRTRTHDKEEKVEGRVYELIAKSEFPYDDSPIPMEEKLDLEISYTLRQIAQLKAQHNDTLNADIVRVDVSQIANRKSIKELADCQQVREYLQQKSYTLSEDGETVILNVADLLDPGGDEDEDENEDEDEEKTSSSSDRPELDDNDESSVLKNCANSDENFECGLRKCESDWDLS